MKGLEISRGYYKDIISPIINEHRTYLEDKYCAALIGWGSDVLGNDDELSVDHEWGPRCIIFIPESLSEHKNSIYEVLNTHIPCEYKGFTTRFKNKDWVRVPDKDGDVHIEVTTCKEYMEESIGMYMPTDDIDWLGIPENKLLEFTGGEVFYDGFNEITKLREFYSYFPEDVWKFRLSYAWQSLGWNIDLIELTNKRGDILSARHCLSVTLHRLMKIIFLLNREYCPSYYKWLHREFYKLPNLSNKVGIIIEELYIEKDFSIISERLKQIVHYLLEYQNNLGLLPNVEIKYSWFSRGFFDIDFNHIAEQVQGSIKGDLRNIDLDGALDQWITNEDILLDSRRIKKLRNYYK